MHGDDASVLRGQKLRHVYHEDNEVQVSGDGGITVAFSSRREDDDCVLTVAAGVEPKRSGHELMADSEGRAIVRVHTKGEQVSLHLDDGEILHVFAVTNEEGCRVATRQEREHSRGAQSLLDRLLGRLRA